MEIPWTIKTTMEPELEFVYLELYRMGEKTSVPYKAKNGKIVKTFIDHKFQFGAQIWEKE